MNWTQAIAMIAAGHDVEHVLDIKSAADRESFRAFILKEAETNPRAVAALEHYDQNMRDIDSGVWGARSAWHSISEAQRRALEFVVEGHGRLVRMRYRSDYGREPSGDFPPKPIRVKTLRNLCAHDLTAWDGGAFDPEAAAVITERGRFVLRMGRG